MIPWLVSQESGGLADLILGEELGQSNRSGEPPAQRARDAADEGHGDRGRRPAQAASGRSADARGERPRRPAQDEIGRIRRPTYAPAEPAEQNQARLPDRPRRRYWDRILFRGV